VAGDRVQFAIDVAAEMTGGAVTIGELDQIASKFTGAGSASKTFDAALVQLSNEMTGAAAATAALDADVAAAARSVQQAESRLGSLEASAREAARANGDVVPESMAAEIRQATAALAQERAQLDGLEADAKRAAAAQARLGRAHMNVTRIQQRHRDRLGDLTRDLSTFRGALGDVGGPLGRLGEQVMKPAQAFVDLQEYMGAGVAVATVAVVGFAAVAAAIVAVGVAAAAAVAGVAALGFALADSARNAQLNLDALAALDPALAGLGGTMRDVGAVTTVSDADMIKFARGLRDAKVSAADLPQALRAVATAESAIAGQGDAVIAKMKEAKGSVSDVATEVQQKFGGIVEQRMLSLDTQAATLQRNLGRLFGGLEIEPALQGMSRLVALFDENSASGKALKAAFEAIMQPLVDAVEYALPIVEAAFLGIVAGGLEVYIKIKPAFEKLGELLGDTSTDVDWLETAFQAARIATIAVAGTIAVLAGALVVVIGYMIGTARQLGLLAYYAGYAAGALLDGLGGALSSVADYVQSALDSLYEMVSAAARVGTDLITGLADGITAGAGKVMSAMTGAVGGAIAAAKRQLGIASPSKVFLEIGGQTAEGMAIGIDDGAGQVQSSMADMASSESVEDLAAHGVASSAGASSAASSAASQSGPMVDMRGAVITFEGLADAPSGIEEFGEMLTRVLRGDAIMVGAAA